MVNLTSCALIIASSLTLIDANKVTFLNNCKDNLTVRSYTSEGDFEPFPKGKDIPVGHSEIFDFGSKFWAGGICTKELKNYAHLVLNLEKEIDLFATGTDNLKFDVPIEIKPSNERCKPTSCFGKSDEPCMIEKYNINLFHVCSKSDYKVTFCPSIGSTSNNFLA